ncbi:hypothetical protein COMA2_70145 [Candidatus Nitrospira nitrificans]|uniref:Uncharacterized protein n=1 Tax=Candidatus Nitrospira nitrificans TaxID=1742973 RepID=A0A0S4LPB0_9BACT|nr:hypothetical protein COMA2_70145 [Candidatus Nitrospira nitrificans]
MKRNGGRPCCAGGSTRDGGRLNQRQNYFPETWTLTEERLDETFKRPHRLRINPSLRERNFWSISAINRVEVQANRSALR